MLPCLLLLALVGLVEAVAHRAGPHTVPSHALRRGL